jgi:hypothetical protein
VKLCVTFVAAAYVVLPACEAVIEQVPTPSNVTEKPVTEQTDGVPDVSETVNPELAVGVKVIGFGPNTTLASGAKVIVCGSLTRKLWVTGVATAYCAFPPCVAVMEQVPIVKSVTEEPETVQTLGVLEM